jgi:MYXO-CTERM domain-containing protein
VRIPSARLLPAVIALLTLAQAASAVVNAGGCPNPPDKCTAQVLEKVGDALHDGYDAQVHISVGGVDVTVHVSAENATLKQGRLTARVGDAAQVNFTVDALGDPNATVPVRLLVHPHVDGLAWTGPTDTNVTAGATAAHASAPFRITSDPSGEGRGFSIPFYVVVRDGDLNNSWLAYGSDFGLLGIQVDPALPHNSTANQTSTPTGLAKSDGTASKAASATGTGTATRTATQATVTQTVTVTGTSAPGAAAPVGILVLVAAAAARRKRPE